MSGDLLRRAAAKLREHAERIPTAENEEPWYRTEPPQYGFWRVLCEVAPDDAEFVALMSPAVGLALADWLDDAADRTGIPEYPSYGLPEKAMAVARAVLREEKS